MNILVLPNAFKGSLSAAKAALLFTRELGKKHNVRALPVSDGGDGFIDFFRTLDPNARPVPPARQKRVFKKPPDGFFIIIRRENRRY